MQNTYSLLKSRTFWTVVVMALIPVLNMIVPTLPPAYQALAEVILAALASIFHNATAQNAGATN